MMVAASLQLEYAFKSKPDLILASASGSNPNSIDLEVMITNRSLSGTGMNVITIQIPTGEETGQDISSAPNMPPPQYDPSQGWTIAVTAATIKITPANGQTGTITGSIVFTLPGIQVNQMPGTVPITITEVSARGKVVDATSYSLTKWPSDLAVTSFQSEPSVLHDLGQYVTLYWTCTDQGTTNSYGLQAEISPMDLTHPGVVGSSVGSTAASEGSIRLHDCITDGICYTSADGTSGVRYGPVTQTTTFVLDVVKASSVGDKSVIGTVRTTVQVLVPIISPNSTLQQSASGQMVTLRWLAQNAASCSVEQDGQVIAQNVPANTYTTGYNIFLPSGSGSHEFTVVAHAFSGSAQASMLFQSKAAGAPKGVRLANVLGTVAVSPDGSLALLPASNGNLAVVDLNAQQLLPNLIPTQIENAPWLRNVAFSADSTLAFVSQVLENSVAVVDLTTKTIDPTTIAVNFPQSVACTPDGSLLLVASGMAQGIVLVDLPSRQVHQTTIPVNYALGMMSITSDSALAVMGSGNNQFDEAYLIDIGGRRVAASLQVGAGPHDIVITSDDALALVMSGDGTVRVIDIAAQTVEAQPISIGHPAAMGSLAVTPDPRWAFVATNDTAELRLIDVAARTSTTFAPLAGTQTYACAIPPTGSAVVLLATGLSDPIVLF